MVPQADDTCKAPTCDDHANSHDCEAQGFCQWDGQHCLAGGTCCDYYELPATRATGGVGALGKPKKTKEEAMALCDSRMGKCTGVRRNTDGSFSAVTIADISATTEGNKEDVLFPRGQCRRVGTATCARDIGGKPTDLDLCATQQKELQEKYTTAVEKVTELQDEAAIAMSDETLKKCRKREGDRFIVALTQLEDATIENAELCKKTSMSIQELSPQLTILQGSYDDLLPLIEKLKSECADAGEVSKYLKVVRDAITNLEDCPGNMKLDLPHGEGAR
jgi:hypothetical protein